MSHIPHFVWKSRTIKGTFLSLSLIIEWIVWMNIWWTFMFLKEFRDPSLYFEFMHFRNSFCYRIENNWSFKYKILSHVSSPLWTKLIILSPLGLLKFQDFQNFLFILKLSYSKIFWNNLNYVSTANIQEVIKFHNQGDKSFETDFISFWLTLLYLFIRRGNDFMRFNVESVTLTGTGLPHEYLR